MKLQDRRLDRSAAAQRRLSGDISLERSSSVTFQNAGLEIEADIF